MAAILAHDILLQLQAAAVAGNLLQSRSALLVGIDRAIVDSLPISSTPGGQVLEDLDALNRVGTLVDGTTPLELWLKNAQALSRMTEESAVFAATLAALRLSSDEPASRSVPVARASRSDAPPTPISPQKRRKKAPKKGGRTKRARPRPAGAPNDPQFPSAKQPGSGITQSVAADHGGLAVAAAGNVHVVHQPVPATNDADVERARIRYRYGFATVCALCLASIICLFLHQGGLALLFFWSSILLNVAGLLHSVVTRQWIRGARQFNKATRRVLATYVLLSLLAQALTTMIATSWGVPLHSLVVPHLPSTIDDEPGWNTPGSTPSPGSAQFGSGVKDDAPFDCGDGQKAPSNSVCDGDWDCPNGADEDPQICKSPIRCCVASNGCRTEPLDGHQKLCDCCPNPDYVCCVDPREGCCKGGIYGPPE